MLKLFEELSTNDLYRQPPSGGCVLKPVTSLYGCFVAMQPPSGGCVLKLDRLSLGRNLRSAAAFGRLCVETAVGDFKEYKTIAAAFGRLCVETMILSSRLTVTVAAAFGRLCVETSH